MSDFSSKEINKAQDNFKKYCGDTGSTCNTDSIFNSSHESGKGDEPRNMGKKFKDNFDSIFPNSYKPYWQKNEKDK